MAGQGSDGYSSAPWPKRYCGTRPSPSSSCEAPERKRPPKRPDLGFNDPAGTIRRTCRPLGKIAAGFERDLRGPGAPQERSRPEVRRLRRRRTDDISDASPGQTRALRRETPIEVGEGQPSETGRRCRRASRMTPTAEITKKAAMRSPTMMSGQA